jgi:energy-converting hydrogenase Eha subunit C
MKNPKPTWWMLYALLPLALVLLVVAHRWLPVGSGRALVEAVVSLVVIAAMALWVRANRLALALLDEVGEKAQPFRAWVAYQPPARPRRPQIAA